MSQYFISDLKIYVFKTFIILYNKIMKFLYQRLMIKTSIFYFLAGTLIGFFMFLGYNFENFSFFFKLREVHAHLLFLGFVIQMIMGVGLWMFPRKTPQEPEERVKLYRKEEKQGLSLYFLFNSGTVLRSIFKDLFKIKIFITLLFQA